jgi:hypothetical protein
MRGGGRPCSQGDLCALAAGASGDTANYGCGGACGNDPCREVDIVAVVVNMVRKPPLAVDAATEAKLAEIADALAADGDLELGPGALKGLGPRCALPPGARRAARAVWGSSGLLDGPAGRPGDPDWAPDRCGLCPACRGLLAEAADYSVVVEPRADDRSPGGIQRALAAHAREVQTQARAESRPRPIPREGQTSARRLPAWLPL